MKRLAFIISALLLAALSCNLPNADQGPDAAFTAAAQTVEVELTGAALTQAAGGSTATNTPLAVTATLTSTLAPTITPPPPTATQICDLAQYITDVNVPDGTVFAPDATFTKTWRLKNIGVCAWTGYSLVFDNGDSMGGLSPTAIGTVNPGQEIDISIGLTAPASNGSYRGYWRLRNASGVLLPIQGGSQGNKTFFVDIRVALTSSGYDLHTRAPQATWMSGAGAITFGGPDTDPNGFAMYKNGQKVEGGSTPTKVLELHPQWVDNGVITGLYPAYTVVSGEHFKATIGFLALSDGSCGTGNAIFQVNYKESGTLHPLGSWTHACNGSLVDIDIPLTSIAGHNVQFALAVMANGSAGQDWAVFINPRVLIP
jgi:hypothetical protein